VRFFSALSLEKNAPSCSAFSGLFGSSSISLTLQMQSKKNFVQINGMA
jgi:hypothetical protein